MTSTVTFDFSGLTSAQQWLIVLGGWHIGAKLPNGDPSPQPSKRSVQKLIERGLVVPREVKERAGPFAITVTEYDVPVAVHMAYCADCALRAGEGSSPSEAGT